MNDELETAFKALDEVIHVLHVNHGLHFIGMGYRPAQLSPLGNVPGLSKTINFGDPLIMEGLYERLGDELSNDLEEASVDAEAQD